MTTTYLRTACLAAFALLVGLTGTRAEDKAKAKAEMDIVETAVAAGKFTKLAAALTEAGLVETLKGDGPFTVFAPTDEAFEKVGASNVDALLKDKAKLKSVLTYHVVKGKVMAADAIALSGKTAKSVEGSAIPIKAEGGTVMVGKAKVVKADIKCKNGVIHVIDTVLMPPAH